MLVVMNVHATQEQLERVCEEIRKSGLTPHPIPGSQRTAVGITGNKGAVDPERLQQLPGVIKVIRVTDPYKLVGREFKPDETVIRINGKEIGGDRLVVMAGPCAVESREQLFEVAHIVREAGATVLRGGAFKPRTSPYSVAPQLGQRLKKTR